MMGKRTGKSHLKFSLLNSKQKHKDESKWVTQQTVSRVPNAAQGLFLWIEVYWDTGPFVFPLSMTALRLQQQGWVVRRGGIRSSNLKSHREPGPIKHSLPTSRGAAREHYRSHLIHSAPASPLLLRVSAKHNATPGLSSFLSTENAYRTPWNQTQRIHPARISSNKTTPGWPNPVSLCATYVSMVLARSTG